MATERKKLDWEAIEREYRAGQLSIREIARQYGCSDAAIHKRAKRDKWLRDLAEKVRKRVREKLVRGLAVSSANATDDELVESAAERGVEVQQLHRQDIRCGHDMVRVLTAQLAEVAQSRDEIEYAIEEATKKDNGTQRRNAMMKAVSLPTHAGILRDLSVALKNLVPLERQAFNLDDEGSGIGLDELIGLITKKNPQVASRVVEMLRDE